MYISGVNSQEEELENKWLKKKNTVILFPSQDSKAVRVTPHYFTHLFEPVLKIPEFLESNPSLRNTSSTVTADIEAPPLVDEDDRSTLNICLLDGTWAQAKHLNSRIPKYVPRIRLSTVQNYKPLFDALRKQSMQGRISTFEAAVMCMKELGESEQTLELHMNNLKTMIIELRKQVKKDKPLGF